MEYLSALIVGLVGSLHCAGMCGPIAVAIPLNNSSWLSRGSGAFLYNIGRTLTYALLRAIVGLATGQVTDVHEAIIAAEKARISLEILAEMRNKLVASYQEIMRMQI